MRSKTRDLSRDAMTVHNTYAKQRCSATKIGRFLKVTIDVKGCISSDS